eukprot:CAMPEP_0118925280 /NCGR_PEP_ID=MMETSP1169-20130426/3195_1 /TAXON_ID=36882 /ORGANISM="Pyramimonas obovata, Strain CCMP722" /LENGTH=197 /DNA_ID=CAMNT_0006866531 /DNA_START=278 /DNA_END=868 /DNA_ORIENTATION=-
MTVAVADPSSDALHAELVQYLRRCRAALRGSDPVTVVMGNEAADLDSCVSALTYAFLLDKEAEPGSPPVVPMINIPRDDFSLRPDAVHLMAMAAIPEASLLFEEDVGLPALAEGARLAGLVLVDHNRVAAKQEGLLPRVVEILDHHVDERMYPAEARVTISLVGSTCSLVAAAFRERCPGALASPTLRRLLKAGILL